MTLRGPADPDRFRIDYKRSRYYFDDLPADELRPEGPMTKKAEALPALSTVKNAEGKDGLLYWAVGLTAEAAVDDRDKWERLDRDDAVDYLKKRHTKQRDRAAGRGTDLHDFVERRMRGEPASIWDELDGDAAAYADAVEHYLSELRPELLFAEVVVFGDRYGGTIDAIVRYPTLGLVSIVDYKSRRAEAKNPHVVYDGEVCQIGGYSNGRYMIVEEDGVARRLPLPELDCGVLVTFTPDRYVAHRIELAEARAAFDGLYGWWAGMKTAKKAVGAPLGAGALAIPADVEEILDELVDDEEPSETVASDAEIAALRVAHAETISSELERRIRKLLDTGHEAALLARWPDGVPGLSSATPAQYPAIEKALDRAEADVGAPFDPSPAPVQGPEKPPPPAVERPAPLDEGGRCDDAELEAIRAGYELLDVEPAEWVNALAAAAGNLSASALPSKRRAAIAFALVRLAAAGWHDDELLAAVLDKSAPTFLVPEIPVALRLSELSASDAERLAAVVSDLVEERLVWDASGDRLRLSAVAS